MAGRNCYPLPVHCPSIAHGIAVQGRLRPVAAGAGVAWTLACVTGDSAPQDRRASAVKQLYCNDLLGRVARENAKTTPPTPISHPRGGCGGDVWLQYTRQILGFDNQGRQRAQG